jgi:hypothetical protein
MLVHDSSELERFKCNINLIEFALTEGYRIDRRESSPGSVVMRHLAGDKIVIARGHDGHWIYFSVRDEGDNGSIIDFIQHRRRCSLADVRAVLRPWVGGVVPLPLDAPPVPGVAPVSRDRASVLRALALMRPVVSHRYLEVVRGIPRACLTSGRFAGRVLVDRYGNAIFPHADLLGPCGYEAKNRDYTGFAKGGEKGLWVSGVRRTDRCLVIAESAIDAMSYAVLVPDPTARYASFGGACNPTQPALLAAAVSRLGEGACVVVATDNDPEGERFGHMIFDLVAATGRADLSAVRARPTLKDWNAVLTVC